MIMTGRTAVLIDDKPVLIDQVCVPDPTTTVSLQRTNDGCANSLFDDYANQVTYGSQRFFYIRTDGQRVYVTACAQDEGI